MEFLIRTNFNTSFRQKLQEKLFQILDSFLSELYQDLKNPIPMELAIKLLTSLVLNIAEYFHESPRKDNKQMIAETIFKSILQGPAKTLGLIK